MYLSFMYLSFMYLSLMYLSFINIGFINCGSLLTHYIFLRNIEITFLQETVAEEASKSGEKFSKMKEDYASALSQVMSETSLPDTIYCTRYT